MEFTSNGKVRRSKSEWERIIASFEGSGVSQEQFCEREQVAKSSFSKWYRKLRGKGGASNVFVELKPGASAWDMELSLGGDVVLRMRRG